MMNKELKTNRTYYYILLKVKKMDLNKVLYIMLHILENVRVTFSFRHCITVFEIRKSTDKLVQPILPCLNILLVNNMKGGRTDEQTMVSE